jgi:hypothetical protein
MILPHHVELPLANVDEEKFPSGLPKYQHARPLPGATIDEMWSAVLRGVYP